MICAMFQACIRKQSSLPWLAMLRRAVVDDILVFYLVLAML